MKLLTTNRRWCSAKTDLSSLIVTGATLEVKLEY